MKKYFFLTISIITILINQTFGQNASGQSFVIGQDSVRVITTAAPFLTISPDARSGAMGETGVATSPDANAIRWNPAKLPFIEDKSMGFSISYTPWLRKLINDMSISYLAGYKKIRKQEVIGINLLYFDLGSIQFTDNNGNPIKDFNPQEYVIGATYSRKLSDNLGLGLGLKFIHSNLSGNLNIDANGTVAKSGNAAAADLGVYYTKPDIMIGMYKSHLAFGATITNVGNKISYTNNNQADFIPTNLKIGSAVTTEIDAYNKFTLTADFNKLMVPTPPVYTTDSTGKTTIVRGKNPDRSLLSGIFGSFADAPDGFKEEMREWMVSVGAEYWYNDLFAARGGYFMENRLKGNRKYFTLGFGLRYQLFGLDFAYLIPVKQNNPLAETLRFTLHFSFQSKKAQQSVTE